MATTLANVQAAEQEAKAAKQRVDALDQLVIPTDITPEEKRVETVYNVLFKLVRKKKGRMWLDNCCDNVINPKTQTPERIWLLNGARSIWDSELEYIMKDKNRYERSRRGMDIVFVDGVLRVRSTDTLRLEFLRNHADNVGKRRTGTGKYGFYEYDPQQEQKDRMAKQMTKIEMVIKAKEMPIEKAIRLASFLGIAFVDELGQRKSDEGIRTELMVKADTDPVTFQKYIDSKEVEVSYLVRRGIIEAKIDLTGQTGNAIWANGKGFIAKIPSTRKPLEYLTELAMTNSDEGRKFKEQLEQIVT